MIAGVPGGCLDWTSDPGSSSPAHVDLRPERLQQDLSQQGESPPPQAVPGTTESGPVRGGQTEQEPSQQQTVHEKLNNLNLTHGSVPPVVVPSNHILSLHQQFLISIFVILYLDQFLCHKNSQMHYLIILEDVLEYAENMLGLLYRLASEAKCKPSETS